MAQTNGKKFVDASDSHFAYIGRFDLTNKKQPVFMFSGSTIKTMFSGTSVTLDLQDDSLRNLFTIIVDDNLTVLKTDKSNHLYTLASNLQNKTHSLQVIRRTEWHGGDTKFNGLYIDKDGKLNNPSVHNKTIEFIGDSYTCGYGNEGKNHNEHFTYETENNYLSYGAVTARMVNAEYIGICLSGIGMYQGYGGNLSFVMPDYYDRVTNNKQLKWDYKKSQPDLVVIDLSGNDFSAALDSVKFTESYLRFLKRIRTNYVHTPIVCIAGPSSGGKEWMRQQNFIKTVVQEFSKTNKSVHYFSFSPFEMNGSDWHPNVAEDAKMAAELVPFLKKLQF